MNRKQRRQQASRGAASLDYEALFRKLREHHEAVRLAPARAIYDRILADDNPHALELFGRTAVGYQEFDRAEALLEKAIALGRSGASIHSELGLARMGGGDLAGAEQSLETAVALEDDDFRAWINLATVHRDQGRGADAVRALERSIERNPLYPNAHLHLAEARLRAKEPEEALRSIEVAEELAPGSTWGLALRSVALCELDQVDALARLMAFDDLVQIIDAGPPPGFDDVASFHRSLSRHIRRHPTLTREPYGFSTRSGAQTLGNLLRDRERVVRALEAQVDRALACVLDGLPPASPHPQITRRPERYRLEGWGVSLARGGHQEAHIHRDGWLSAVYYVDLGDAVEPGGDHEGWLELGRGPGDLYGRGSTPETVRVRPEPGRFVIFPSYVWHRTIPFHREGPRLSFAFDVIPA